MFFRFAFFVRELSASARLLNCRSSFKGSARVHKGFLRLCGVGISGFGLLDIYIYIHTVISFWYWCFGLGVRRAGLTLEAQLQLTFSDAKERGSLRRLPGAVIRRSGGACNTV